MPERQKKAPGESLFPALKPVISILDGEDGKTHWGTIFTAISLPNDGTMNSSTPPERVTFWV